MKKGEATYLLQGNKKHRDLVKESKQQVGDNSPDLSKSNYQIKVDKTTYFCKTEQRYLKLKKQLENGTK